MLIGLCANLRADFPFDPKGPPDQFADWDIEETVAHIRSSIERLGHTVEFLEPSKILGCKDNLGIDAILSICEMVGGPFRESIVPCLCEYEGVPYFFSSPDSLHNTLDKNLANLIAQQASLLVPRWVNIEQRSHFNSECISHLRPPYIVKPAAEGSGMGMSDARTLCSTPEESASRVRELQDLYDGDVIVQEFVNGREFTIGVIEVRGVPQALHPIEIAPKLPTDDFIYSFHAKENSRELVDFVPLEDERSLLEELQTAAKTVHSKFKCREVSRIDFRYDSGGKLHFLEINALPHFHPEIGDFCRSAISFGYSYDEMWATIIASFQDRGL